MYVEMENAPVLGGLGASEPVSLLSWYKRPVVWVVAAGSLVVVGGVLVGLARHRRRA